MVLWSGAGIEKWADRELVLNCDFQVRSLFLFSLSCEWLAWEALAASGSTVGSGSWVMSEKRGSQTWQHHQWSQTRSREIREAGQHDPPPPSASAFAFTLAPQDIGMRPTVQSDAKASSQLDTQ